MATPDTFTFHTFLQPQRIIMGYVGVARDPIYANCGRCNAPDAVIHSCHKGSDGNVAVLKIPNQFFVRPAFYCHTCTETLCPTTEVVA